MAKKNKKGIQIRKYRVNEEIRYFGNVRIVGEGIETRIVDFREARRIANEMELDLIELNPNAEPPVMKIASYEKMIYEMKKAAKKAKQNTPQVKEIQLSVNIAANDLKTKANKARDFLKDGHKVKVVLSMRGRELARRDENKRSLFEFIDSLDDVCVPESMPQDERNKTIVYLKRKNESRH